MVRYKTVNRAIQMTSRESTIVCGILGHVRQELTSSSSLSDICGAGRTSLLLFLATSGLAILGTEYYHDTYCIARHFF